MDKDTNLNPKEGCLKSFVEMDLRIAPVVIGLVALYLQYTGRLPKSLKSFGVNCNPTGVEVVSKIEDKSVLK
jgi:hypothetical protein